MRLLDLFCGAGGCSEGYRRAGFEVVGVDNRPQPNYPFKFFRQDALRMLRVLALGGRVFGRSFDAIHASPPCPAYSTIGKQVRGRDASLQHPDLVGPTRDLLRATGLPYVIENVPGAPLEQPVMICGSSLGLDVRRHRLFETNWSLMVPPCAHGWQTPRFVSLDKRRAAPRTIVPGHGSSQLASVVGVHGHINYAGEQALRAKAMGIDWMSPYELTQAIPPVYTELVGHQLMAHLRAAAA